MRRSRATRISLLRIGLSEVTLKKLNAALVIALFANFAGGTSPRVPQGAFDRSRGAFDRFEDINCEDEMARLDSLTVALQQHPHDRVVIIFYGGRAFRGRLPKRGEAEARAARLKPYLVTRRGIESSRVDVVNGGYQHVWNAELWIVPPGTSAPSPFPTVKADQMKFRKGKAHPRDYRCRI